MILPSCFKTLSHCRANVIWPQNCSREEDLYALFRKTFSHNGRSCKVRLFANTYYNLYIDGSFLHRGPVRRHEMHAEFDELTLQLTPGSHVIAVLVHHLGVECAGHRKGARSFWCEIETGGDIIVSDESWKAMDCTSFRTLGWISSHYDFCEDVDLTCFPTGWEQKGFDDSHWPDAQVLCCAGSEQDIHKNYTARTLKTFSYPREQGVIIRTGTYTNCKTPTGFYVKDFFNRGRDADRADGSYALAEFSATVSGCVEIHYENKSDQAEIIIAYDDFLNDHGFISLGRMGDFADRFIVPQGSGTVKVFMPRGFRYILADISASGRITAIYAEKEEYPYEEKTGFSAGLNYWSGLYTQSVRTQQVCTIDGFTDCVNRERVLWLGDAYFDCLGSYYSTADKGLLLTTLYEHAMGEGPMGALGGYNSSDLRPGWLYMPAYNMMYLHMLCDYILYTGDEENVLPLKETAQGILRFLQDNMNDRGIFDSTWKNCNNYWDWGYAEPEGESLKSNAYFIHTIERMAKIPFFNDVVDEALLKKVQHLKLLCRDLFWDAEKQVYRDCSTSRLTTQGANAYAVLGGICPRENIPQLLHRITDECLLDDIPVGENQENENSAPDESKILPAATMYGATAVCRAMLENGMTAEGLRYMRHVWGDFEGLPTLPELRRNGTNNTMCHGWSAAPAFLLPMYVLGLRPLENGCKHILFAPPCLDPDMLSQAKGSMPTPLGTIYAQWCRIGDFLRAEFVIPTGVTLTLSFSNQDYLFTQAGNHTVYLPCRH